jgi:hypothetical protein
LKGLKNENPKLSFDIYERIKQIDEHEYLKNEENPTNLIIMNDEELGNLLEEIENTINEIN